MRVIWEVKETPTSPYVRMPSPSGFKTDWEDLDKDSYRSINSGNLIDTVVSQSWTKLYFEYNNRTDEELKQILPVLKRNPMYVRAKNNIFGTDFVEMEMRCSKKSSEMLENGDNTLNFNLVQKKKVAGQ